MTLRWVPGWNGLTEPEAVSYVAAVEAADGQELEFGVAKAINDFVLGCKNDGIWDAIKASCILAGARTLAGALVPLVGTAPTNYNFVSGDYDRETGLIGDGSTKYLDSKRNNNADPQNSNHNAVYVSTAQISTIGIYIGSGASDPGRNNLGHNPPAPESFARNRSSGSATFAVTSTGFIGHSRSSETSFVFRANGSNTIANEVSTTPENAIVDVFRRGTGSYANARIAFYSIGESLDLAALDTRVSNLITAIGAAIP